MEQYSGQIIAGIAIILIGAAIIAMVKATLRSAILEMQQYFVALPICKIRHESLAVDRESLRKDIQNHEERLNGIGA